jgi:hypothetical protein
VRRGFYLSVVAVLTTAASPAAAAKFFEEAPGALAGAADWTNYLRLADLDSDGDLDLVVPNCGGFFANPSAQPFRLYLNDGKGGFVESPSRLGGPFAAAIRVVDVADIDGDGDEDLFAPSADGSPDRLFLNDGKGTFSNEAATRIGSGARAAGARFFDADGDGDVDLFVGAGYAAAEPVVGRLYRNDGKGVFSEVQAGLPSSGPKDIDDVDAFDADGDGDLDLLLTSHGGMPALWLNGGDGSFTDATAKLALGSGGQGYKYGPTACDVDGDGDLDLWIDNSGPNYTEALLINDGTGAFSDETSARVSGNPGADDNGVVCADVDLDGDYDAVVVSLSDVERVLLNDGKGHFTNAGGFPSIGDSSLWLDVGDLDGDGRLDAVTGQGESGAFENRLYRGVGDNLADSRAPVVAKPTLPATIAKDLTIPARFRVADRVLVDAGPRVSAFVRVSVDDAAPFAIAARFVGGDWFHADVTVSEGASVAVEACATDMQGNTGCSAKSLLTGPGRSTSVGAGGAGGSSSTAGQGGSATAGPGGQSPSGTTEDSSCAVVAPGRRAPITGALWALVAALASRRLRARFRSR